MKRLLHHPRAIRHLRPLKPLYRRLAGRAAPAALTTGEAAGLLARLGGRAVFLFAFGRSGSTVLCDFLGSHRHVVSLGEPLNESAFHSLFRTLGRGPGGGASPSAIQAGFYRYVARLVDRNPGMRCVFDLKLESLHVIEGNWRDPGPRFQVFDALAGSGCPVILLERRDLALRHLSAQLAVRRRRFHSFEPDAGAVEPFEIDTAALVGQARAQREQIACVREAFAGAPGFLHLCYEDLFAADGGGTRIAPGVVQAVAELLDVDADGFDPVPSLARLGADDPGRHVRNRAEFEACRRGLLAEISADAAQDASGARRGRAPA